MPRVKRGVSARKKHKKVLQRTAGHWGAARESMMHALLYSYRDRRNRKRDFRRLWITRINAASRLYGLRYGELIHGLQLAGVQVDRKILADLAVVDLAAFGALARTAQTALQKRSA